MSELSSIAQAVLTAYHAGFKHPVAVHHKPRIAAALRAAADQAVPEMSTPWNSTLTPKVSAVGVRAQLLAIADELEAHD